MTAHKDGTHKGGGGLDNQNHTCCGQVLPGVHHIRTAAVNVPLL